MPLLPTFTPYLQSFAFKPQMPTWGAVQQTLNARRQGAISTYHPTLTDRAETGIQSGLAALGVDPGYSKRFASRAVQPLNDLTPFGSAVSAEDARNAFKQGRPAAGMGNLFLAALGVLPEGRALGRFAEKGVGKALGGMFGGRVVKAYHGGRGFEGEFDLSKVGSGLGRAEEPAIWFTPDRDEANRYAWSISPAQTYNGKAIYPANIDTSGFHETAPGAYDPELFAQIIADARNAKKPGVIFKGVAEHQLASPDQIAVFDPDRIKF